MIKTIPLHHVRFERSRNKKQVYIICDDLSRSNVCPYFGSAVTSLLFHTSATETSLVLSPFCQCYKKIEIFFVSRKKETVLQNHQPFTWILLIFCFGLDAGPTHPRPRVLFSFWSDTIWFLFVNQQISPKLILLWTAIWSIFIYREVDFKLIIVHGGWAVESLDNL